MRANLVPSIVVIALASGMGLASAAPPSSSTMPPAAPAAKAAANDSLKLTSAQEKTVWSDVSKQATKQKAPSGFTASVGTAVPTSISLRPVSSTLAGEIPALKTYQYAMVQDKVLIVNPADRKIVDVINHQA